MGQCDTCLELKNLRQSGASKTEINQTIACYIQLHSSARTMFTHIRDRASQQPFNILYLQFDEKQASYIPHIMPLPKETQYLPQHLQHITILLTLSFGLYWSKIQLHILVAISFKMKVSFGTPSVYLKF